MASEHARRAMVWNAAGLDRTLRLDYPLDESSVVLDVGGYQGQWASDIYGRYSCCVEIFEPVDEFAAWIEWRFARNKKIHVHRFGLAGRSRNSSLCLRGDGSTVVDGGTRGVTQTVRLLAAEDAFRLSSLDRVDLMKINIEGAEYELLDHLIASGLIHRIRDVQVQFHDVGGAARTRMEEVRIKLGATHYPTFLEDFIWENWRLRAGPEPPPRCLRPLEAMPRLRVPRDRMIRGTQT